MPDYEKMKKILLNHVSETGNFPTAIPSVRIAMRDRPGEFAPCFYTPTCMFVLEGEKEVLYGGKKYRYGKGEYAVCSADIPLLTRVSKAKKDEPFLVVITEFDSSVISELMYEAKLSPHSGENAESFGVAPVNEELTETFYRLIKLLDCSENEQQFYSALILKEIFYRLLTGDFGAQLQLINMQGTRLNQITQAISYLKQNYRKKLNIDDIAGHISMAPSSFYRVFKQVTKISPLQYQKHLKLHEAQRLMLSGQCDVSQACYEVGYESITQFNREYKKMFGLPPKTDITKKLSL